MCYNYPIFHFIVLQDSYSHPFFRLFRIMFTLKSHYSLTSFPDPKFFIYFVSFPYQLSPSCIEWSSPAPKLLFLKLASYRLRLLKMPLSLFSHSHRKNLHLLPCLKYTNFLLTFVQFFQLPLTFLQKILYLFPSRSANNT
jgi:hypothetical protein